ncbi:MAG: hypothetical protein WDO68_22445 [Gammaproteobacteria bacterium]
MKPESRLFVAWLLASALGFVIMLVQLPAAFVDGHYVPLGPDSFYHSARILESVANPAAFFQFDAKTHVPEGNLITWPWAYDYLMALIVRAGLALHLSADPLAILLHIPVFAFPVCLALIAIICRQLRLGAMATTLAIFAMAVMPLNQSLYGIGNIDQHYAENLFVLGSLATSLGWLRKPESGLRAATLGIVLGLAPGVHMTAFVLQVPLVAAFIIAWLRQMPMPRNAHLFAIALIVACLAVALPSLPLQRGYFQYQMLSWFQVYIAACTGTLILLMCRYPARGRGLIGIAAVALLMLIPLGGQILLANDFFTVSIEGMDDISEVQSPLKMALQPGGILYVGSFYTLLFVLAPVSLGVSLWKAWEDRAPERRYFWVASAFGLVLLAFQLRLQYFGSFALFIPLLYVIDEWTRVRARSPVIVWGTVTVLLAIASVPGFTMRIFQREVLAGDPYYDVTRDIYPKLAKACAASPGVVLANPNDGHYLRYHTQCSVIANNFLVTKMQEQKTREENELLRLPAVQLAAKAPSVKYVYVRRDSLFGSDEKGQLVLMPRGDPRDPDPPLVNELLTTSVEKLPPGFRLLAQEGPDVAPYARAFALEPATR